MPDSGTPDLKTTNQKREWLREQVVKGLHNSRQVKEVHGKLDRMGPQQIDGLVNAILAQQLPPNDPQLALQRELERARMLRYLLEQEYLRLMYGGYGRPVGYMPVVTWLPQGTSFGASGVISADRRYVRVSPMPFFSSIGPVYNYNLNTGETTLQPPYNNYPQYPYGYPYNGYATPPQGPITKAKVWHDGVRGRVGP